MQGDFKGNIGVVRIDEVRNSYIRIRYKWLSKTYLVEIESATILIIITAGVCSGVNRGRLEPFIYNIDG